MMRPAAKGFALGVLATALVGAVLGAIVIWSGVIDVAATASGPQDRILAYASTQSLRHHARADRNPHANDPAALHQGMAHYQAMCVACHGGPGAAPSEFAAGLHPAAPDLSSASIQALSDGVLYQAVSGGIGSTGMPAFGPSHTPEELWSIVAFLRHLPALTPEERTALGASAPHEAEGAHAASHAEANGDSKSSAKPDAREHQVAITGFHFQPATLEVHAGDTIVWTNQDGVAHTATAQDGSFDTGKLDAGQSKRIVVSRPGSFAYFCRFHLAMKGSLTVQ